MIGAKMTDKKTIDADAIEGMDANGDGHISKAEMEMALEFKRKSLEDQDAQRDAMRKMTWFALMGMLLYPFAIVLTSYLGMDEAANIVGDIAPTYFVAISALVAAFFGADALKKK
jgi:FtsH-binding integral membrane protein